MLTIFNPFKFRNTKKIVFYFLLFFLFDNSIYASENFGDAMKWYKNRSLDSDPKYHYMIGLKAEQEELINNAKNSELYKTVLNYFSDAELIDVKTIKKDRE